VSRAHARIERRGAAWVLLDRASANGTHLNGAALAASAALRDGDRIRVGAVTFEFRGAKPVAGAAVAEGAGWWSRLRPPARAGVISGFALVAVAGSGAASWKTEVGMRPGAVEAVQGAPPESGVTDPAAMAAARAAYERGRRKLEERRIAPRNLYDACTAFDDARSRLDGSESAAVLRDETARALDLCEREHAAQCRRLLFSAARFERYGERDKALQAWREILQHFPGDDPAGCRKKARAALIPAQPDDGGE
jgi:hypothetical protein